MNLDTNFGASGFVFRSWQAGSYGYDLDAGNGKVYAGSYVLNRDNLGPDFNTGSDFGLSCVDADNGAPCSSLNAYSLLDPTSPPGQITYDFEYDQRTSKTDVLTTVNYDSDGFVLLSGAAQRNSSSSGAVNIVNGVVRLDGTTGALDESYGVYFNIKDYDEPRLSRFVGGGKSLTKLQTIPTNGNDEMFCSFMEDGRLTLFGFSNPGTEVGQRPEFSMGGIRYLADGTPDNSFGGEFGAYAGTANITLGIDEYTGKSANMRARGCDYFNGYEYTVGRVNVDDALDLHYGFIARLVDGKIDRTYGLGLGPTNHLNILYRGAVPLGDLDGSDNIYLYDLTLASCGTAYVCGSRGNNTYVAAINEEGNIVWERQFSYANSPSDCRTIVNDGDYLYTYGGYNTARGSPDGLPTSACLNRHKGTLCGPGTLGRKIYSVPNHDSGYFSNAIVYEDNVYVTGRYQRVGMWGHDPQWQTLVAKFRLE